MLLQLAIKNFALIKEVSISFEEGFNILSGETGAGKSILIDAIVYVLGGKFNKDLIRTGENKTFVEAVFTIDNEKTKKILDEMGLEYEDLVIVTRETYKNGKSITRINNKAVILSKLKRISDTLIDIHGQHNNQSLLDKSSHIKFLDSYKDSDLELYFSKYKTIFFQIKDIQNKIKEINGSEDRERVIEFLKFQIEDIKNANLNVGEEENLKEQYNILSNSEKISKALNISYNILNESQTSCSIIDNLSKVIKELSNIEDNSQKIKNISDKINEVYYVLNDISNDIRDISDNTVYDESILEEINSRIYKISLLKKKYGNSIEKILNYENEIEEKYNKLINSEEILSKLNLKIKEKESILLDLGENISKKRKEIAKILQQKIISELKDVGLEKCRFLIEVNRKEKFMENGLDEVQFLISTNPGEPLKSLDKVVSGGELSRIMLSLKTVFIDKDEISTVIFDEIDTGISGRIAQVVGEKMYQISTKHQVFCITHLPQIASLSDYHYLVTKISSKDSTFSKVEKIPKKIKIIEIAKMLGGIKVTEATSQNAEEMIKLADEKKEIIKNCNT